jgi:hypothetical protein
MPTTGPKLRQRQVHLDFHTPGEIPDVGADFDAARFAQTVVDAHIDSMTVFSKCHHGYSYHPTDIGIVHPSLKFDLMGAQIEALHGAGVRAPIYVSVGWDEAMADIHPEWRQVDANGRFVGRGPREIPGWRLMDLASPYVEYVLAQTREVLERYAPVDGIFFDIVRQEAGAHYNAFRRDRMRTDGIDPEDTEAATAWAMQIERDFMQQAHALVMEYGQDATVFFNSRLRPDREPEAGSRAELPYYTHVEIESLPGGQWGYNHYPLFANYFQTLSHPLLGMTGIFHTAWGDFGSLKTEPALHFECARMVASGAACSIGDQMHPRGVLDAAAYRRIGEVFEHVEALEPWSIGTEAVQEIGVLMAETGPRFHTFGREIDEGVMRMLLELHRPFQFLDAAADLSPYKVIIVPDDRPFDDELAAKVQAYLDGGGSLLVTNRGGLTPAGDRFALDFGVEYVGEAPHSPDFLVAGEEFGAPLTDYPLALYERGSQVRGKGAEVLARVGYPYFTRSAEVRMSHLHTAFDHLSDDPAVTQQGNVIYCHSPLFAAYRKHAVPAYRQLVATLLDRLAPEPVLDAPNLPTTAEATLLRQPAESNRTILHLLNVLPQRRGAAIDIVEEIIPLRDIRVGVRLDQPANHATLAPSGESLVAETTDGVTWVTLPEVGAHAVVIFE